MSLDDDEDCVEHVFGLAQLHLTTGMSQSVSRCVRCGAVAYEVDAPGQDARRPRLG